MGRNIRDVAQIKVGPRKTSQAWWNIGNVEEEEGGIQELQKDEKVRIKEENKEKCTRKFIEEKNYVMEGWYI